MSIFSEKFEKELLTFMFWVSNTEYKISKNNIEVEWSVNLINEFEEPGRNKLECYIKQLMKEYFISFKDLEINDIKFITKKFRENKPKMSKKVMENESKKFHKIDNEKTKENEKSTLNADLVETEARLRSRYRVSGQGNEKMLNICELDYSSMFLVNILGMPTFNKDEYIQYKWNINGKFIIYNWLNSDGVFENFENNKWYLAKPMTNPSVRHLALTEPIINSQNLDLVKKEFYEYINNVNVNTNINKNKNLLICDCCNKKHDDYDILRNHLIPQEMIQEETIQEETNDKVAELTEIVINEYKNLKIDLDDIEF